MEDYGNGFDDYEGALFYNALSPDDHINPATTINSESAWAIVANPDKHATPSSLETGGAAI